MAFNIKRCCTLLLTVILTIVHAEFCRDLNPDIGGTYPTGDIFLREGEDLRITCYVYPNNSRKFNSSHLVFKKESAEITEGVTVLNSTAIELYIQNVTNSYTFYSCVGISKKDGPTAICGNIVMVDEPPIPAKNFICKSQNALTLNCSWEPGRHYSAPTQHFLSYSIPGKSRLSKNVQCPNTTKNKNSCCWAEATQPPFRPVQRYYNLNLTVKNFFGSVPKIYKIDILEIIVPDKPTFLKFEDVGIRSLNVSWGIPLNVYKNKIVSKVSYQSHYDDDWIDTNVNEITGNGSVKNFVITNLNAHTLYDVRVYLRSHIGTEWSQHASGTRRTKATVPSSPPKTAIGSFETLPYTESSTLRNVTLYWQQLPERMKNGLNFSYVLNYSTVDGLHQKSMKGINKNYAICENLLKNSSYIFKVYSSNNEGYSENYSVIRVPRAYDGPPEPASISEIVFSDGSYQLVWRHNDKQCCVTNYTIYWCKDVKELSCADNLNWTTVSSWVVTKDGKLTYSITLSDKSTHKFAISANTNTSSSGMVWASCTVMHGKGVMELNDFIFKNTGPSYVEIEWKPNCEVSVAMKEGFVIAYCPINNVSSHNSSTCKEPLQEMHVEQHSVNETIRKRVDNLKPYTTYMMFLRMKTNDTYPETSKSQFTTLESTPSPPRKIKCNIMTNSFVQLTWDPPLNLNGVIRYYIVRWDALDSAYNETRVQANLQHVIFENLSAYKDYTFKVAACTVSCSNWSDHLSLRTPVGRPSEIFTFEVDFSNSSNFFNLHWAPPNQPAGPISYYEIKVEVFKDGQLDSSHNNVTHHVKDSLLFTLVSNCHTDNIDNYRFFIRAVNIDHDKTFAGPWSVYREKHCAKADSFGRNVLWVFLAFFMCFVGVSIVLVVKCLSRCRDMQNVAVKLPAQLEMDNFKEKELDQNSGGKIGSNEPDQTHDLPPSDRESLLGKRDSVESMTETGEINTDQESSGCGSGHDSVSSSITAGTHVTDSGTEADERPPSPDVFDSPRRNSQLRQRNISGLVGASTSGYGRLTAPPNYIPLPAPTRGYVTHPQLAHPQIWTNSQPTPKGYVVAGTPITSKPPDMYSQVGLNPGTVKISNQDCGISSYLSGDYITDPESGLSDTQLTNPINQTSSI